MNVQDVAQMTHILIPLLDIITVLNVIMFGEKVMETV